ncbi:MAG: phosphatidate cytidylyltransferase [Magnetococcales bacterium]|nr:phosphatidate cytidylyltransferase [Magnetococcales bacterium]
MVLRIVTALILIPVVIWVLFRGGTGPLYLLMLLAGSGLMWEWNRLKGGVDALPLAMAVGVGAVMLALPLTPLKELLWLLPAVLLPALMGLGVWRYQADKPVLDGMLLLMGGLLYCVAPLVWLLEVRLRFGPEWLGLLLIVIWSTDTGALFVGRGFGGPKWIPRVSPGKTWSGFWGGTLCGILGGAGAAYAFSLAIPTGRAIVLSLALSVVGQIGDLAESVVKREAGVKDSGRLIPGHGGLLDRLDSLLFSAPVLAAYLIGVDLLER